MSGFRVDPEGIEAHARAVDAIAGTVSSGAQAEAAGTAQADFGALVGATIGYGVRALSDHFAQSLAATATALAATAELLHGDAATYRDADRAGAQCTTASGAGL